MLKAEEMKDKDIELLNDLLERLDRLIDYAERKNAAIIVFNTAVLTVINVKQLTNSTSYKLIMAANIISFSVALFSFKPLGNLDKFKLKWNLNIFNHQRYSILDERCLNLLYYADIAKFSKFGQYEIYFLRRYKIKVKDEEAFLIKDYAHEIYEDARIANRKYKLFKIAMYINLFMIFVLVFMLFANE